MGSLRSSMNNTPTGRGEGGHGPGGSGSLGVGYLQRLRQVEIDNSKLKEDLDQMKAEHKLSKKEHQQLKADNEALRMENASLKEKVGQLDDLFKWKDRMNKWVADNFETGFDSEQPEGNYPIPETSEAGGAETEIIASTSQAAVGGSNSAAPAPIHTSPITAITQAAPVAKPKGGGVVVVEKIEIDSVPPSPMSILSYMSLRNSPAAAGRSPTQAKRPKREPPSVTSSQSSLLQDEAPAADEVEVDEDAPCAVCGDKWAEKENNEMVFCEKCNVCVHQACYGLQTIPSGDWYCKPCTQNLDMFPECLFCPNGGGAPGGGAMTPVGPPYQDTWAHNSCTLWLPEVSFKDENMDLVVDVDKIDKQRWKMTCVVCKKKGFGACIQCFWNRCTVAFHVTCGQDDPGIRMDKVMDDNINFPHGVALKAYCAKHKQMVPEPRNVSDDYESDQDD